MTTLESSFGFTPEEFDLNATGRLSERQEQTVADMTRRSGRWTIVATIVILLTLGVIGLIALSAADASAAALGAFAIVAAVVVMLFALSLVLGRVRASDLRNRKVSTVSGRARTKSKRTTSEHGGVTLYRLKIGSTKFQLPNKAQLSAFKDGAKYTVHYLRAPGTPIILSAGATG